MWITLAVTPKIDPNPAIATNIRFDTSLLNVSLMAKDKQWVQDVKEVSPCLNFPRSESNVFSVRHR